MFPEKNIKSHLSNPPGFDLQEDVFFKSCIQDLPKDSVIGKIRKWPYLIKKVSIRNACQMRKEK